MASPESHKELLRAAFQKQSIDGKLYYLGLRKIFEDLGLCGDQQGEVLEGVWRAMGSGEHVCWVSFRDVMTSITNATGADSLSPVRRTSPKRPSFVSPIDLPDDDVEIPLGYGDHQQHLPSVSSVPPPMIHTTPSINAYSSRNSSPHSYVYDREGEAQDRAGAQLIQELGRLRSLSASTDTASSVATTTNELLQKRQAEIDSLEAGVIAREQAGMLARTRASFRAHENDQRIAVCDLELTARTDVILRAWRLASVRMLDVIERERRVDLREKAVSNAPPTHRADPSAVAALKLQKEHLESQQQSLEARLSVAATAEADLAARQRDLDNREHMLNKKELSLGNASRAKESLVDREAIAQDRERALQLQETRLQHREEELRESQMRVTVLEKALEDKELNLEDIRNRQNAFEERLVARETQIEETNWKFQHDLSAKLNELTKAENDVKERTARLKQAEKDRSRLDERQRWLAEKEEELNLLDAELRSRRQVVEDNERLKAQIEAREATLQSKEASLKEVMKAKETTTDIREARLDEREKLLSIEIDAKGRMTQQLVEANAKQAEMQVRATAAEAKAAEYGARVKELETLAEQEGVLREKEKYLQIELARMASMETALHEREKAFDKKAATTENWISVIGDREQAAVRQYEAATQATDKAQRERELLIEAKKKRQADEVETNELNMRLKRQEKEWLAWAEKVKQREKRVEQEIKKFRGKQEEFGTFTRTETERLKDWEKQIRDLVRKGKDERASVDRLRRELKEQQEMFQKQRQYENKEVALRSISCTRTIGTEGPTSPVGDEEADGVLSAARELYSKTLAMQDNLDHRQKQLDLREHQLSQVSRPTTPRLYSQPTTPRKITPMRHASYPGHLSFDDVRSVEGVVAAPSEVPKLQPFPDTPEATFTQNILRGAADVMSTCSEETFEAPSVVSEAFRAASTSGDRGSSVATWMTGHSEVTERESLAGNSRCGTPIKQLSVDGSWFNTSLDIAFTSPGNAIGRKAVQKRQSALMTSGSRGKELKGAPLTDSQLALNKISTDMSTLGSTLTKGTHSPFKSPSPRYPSLSVSSVSTNKVTVDLISKSVGKLLGSPRN